MSVISIGQKTIINVLDGSTIEAQYAKNTSPTTPPATGWGPSIPPPEIGYYVWKQERMANPDGTFEPWQSPIRITGDQGQKGDSGTSAIIEYSVGPSNINHPKIPEPIGYAGKGIGYLGKVIGYGFSWDTIAPEVPIGSFLWQRQRVGLLSKWSYSCLTGIQGPPGIPGKLGLSAVGSTLYLKGFNADGSFGATTGLINFGDEQLTIPEAEYTFDEEGPGYIILDTTLSTIVPKFVKMVAVASTPSYVSWRDFNTGTEIAVSSNTNFIVIGTFHVEVDLIDASEIINPVLLNTFTKSHFMDLLNDRQTVTSGNFALWADAMGVTDVFASIAAYEIFTNTLSANEAFIQNLFTQNATIAGILKSDNYSETGGIPTEGFRFDGPNSTVKMFEAVFGDQCTFYGKLLHSLLQTREAVIGNAITISAKTHWTRESFADFLTSKNLPSNSLVPCTGTYNGTAITHVIKATGTNIRLFSRVSWGTTTYTCPFTGNVFLYIIGYYYDGGTISLNGELQLSLSINNARTKTISVNKNDVIYAEMHHPSEVPQYTGCNYHADLVLPSTGLFVILSNGIIQKIDQEAYLQSSIPLSLTYGGTTWNSSSYLKVSGSAIMALLTAVSKGVTLGVTGTLIIDNTARSIVSMFVGASSVLFTWGDSKEILSSGYYNISGTFTPQSVTQAVLTDSLLPLVAANTGGNGKDIGTPVDRYRAVYAKSVDTDAIILGTPSLSANGYSLLPNGLILQWGTVGGSTNPVTLPISITTLLSLAFTPISSNSSAALSVIYSGVVTSSGKITKINKRTTYAVKDKAGLADESAYYMVVGVL